VPHEFRNSRLSLSIASKNVAEGIFDTIEFFIRRISTVFIVDTCRARLFLRLSHRRTPNFTGIMQPDLKNEFIERDVFI
jgi:hypothetical protein